MRHGGKSKHDILCFRPGLYSPLGTVFVPPALLEEDRHESILLKRQKHTHKTPFASPN